MRGSHKSRLAPDLGSAPAQLDILTNFGGFVREIYEHLGEIDGRRSGSFGSVGWLVCKYYAFELIY